MGNHTAIGGTGAYAARAKARGGQGAGTRTPSERLTTPHLTQEQFGQLLASTERFYKRDQQRLADDVLRGQLGKKSYYVRVGGAGPEQKAVLQIAKMMGLAQYHVPYQNITYQGKDYMVAPWVAGKTGEELGNGGAALQHTLSDDERMKLGLFNYLLGEGDRSEYNTIRTPSGSVRQVDMGGSFQGGHKLTPDEYGVLFRTGINHGENESYRGFDKEALRVQRQGISPAVHDWLRTTVLGQEEKIRSAANAVFRTQPEYQSAGRYWRSDESRSVSQAAFDNRLDILREVAALPRPTLGDLSRIAHEDRWNERGITLTESYHAKATRSSGSGGRSRAKQSA